MRRQLEEVEAKHQASIRELAKLSKVADELEVTKEKLEEAEREVEVMAEVRRDVEGKQKALEQVRFRPPDL